MWSVNDYFDHEFDGDVESQADEIVNEAKNKITDLIYESVKSEIEQDRQNYVRAKERDLGDSADGIYKNASQKAEIYIRPCKNEADIVLSGEAVRARYKAFLNKLICIVQQENFRNKEIA